MAGDLISRSALWSEIMMLPHNGDMISSEEVEELLNEAPAVDAEPVVSGEGCVGVYRGGVRMNEELGARWYQTAVPSEVKLVYDSDEIMVHYWNGMLRISVFEDGHWKDEHFLEAEPVVSGSMRVEIVTDDFVNKELARDSGWYRKRYYCPSCNKKLKDETYEKDHCFMDWSVLWGGGKLRYCPFCGTRIVEEVSE